VVKKFAYPVVSYTGPYCQYIMPGLDYGAVGVEKVAGWG